VTAIGKVAAGGTIAVKGGTYSLSRQITVTAAMSGQDGKLKHLVAVPGEHPVLDFSSQPYGKTSSVSNPRGISLEASWWHVKGLDIYRAADNGMLVAGSHNIVEGCTFRANRDSGLQIARANSSLLEPDWPRDNLILNCESYDNYDEAPNAGENADGFACKLTAGPGNVFRGCVSHHNIDDGWDLYTKTDTGPIGAVVIDQCVAFDNGTLTNGTANPNGDKNGFKLGGSSIAVPHVVTRSVAFANGKNGFTWNSNPGVIWLVNNTGWDNVEGNFKFDNPDSLARFVNNVSFWTISTSTSDRAAAASGTVVQDNAFWDKSKKTLWGFTGKPTATVGASAFQSLSAPTTFPLPRLADGSFDLGALARLSSSSPLVDAGIVPNVPSAAGVTALPFDAASYYKGPADGGAFELR
jgi:hypothetical protein